MVIVSSQDGRLLCREPDGSVDTYAELGKAGWNDIVVDGRGSAYVNAIGFDMMAGEEFKPGFVALVMTDGSVRQVADDICVDSQGAVWYADVPNQSCVRVAEGGTVLQTVELDRGGFACALGGLDGTTLFIVAAEWRGMSESETGPVPPGTGQVLTSQVAGSRGNETVSQVTRRHDGVVAHELTRMN